MRKNLIISGGIFHPFEDTSNSLSKIMSKLDYQSEITMDIEEAFRNLEDYDLLTLNALRWRMLNHEKYLPYIDEWQFSLSEEGQKNLYNYMMSGGLLIAFHTSSICFDNWRDYSKILGGKWVWDQTFHPPYGPVEISPILDHEISNKLKPFYLNDEIYHNLELEPSSKPFLIGKTKETDEEHIIAWTYEIGKGKVVYNSLGHDSESLESDEFSEIIRRSIHWIEGKNNE